MKKLSHRALLLALTAPLILAVPAMAQVKAQHTKQITKAKPSKPKSQNTQVAKSTDLQSKPQSKQETNPESTKDFDTVNRPGSVDIATEFDLSNLTIPKDQIHTLLPKDAIPALTNPQLTPLTEATYLQPNDRIIDVTINNNGITESVAVPLKILNFHEIANITVAGKPVAATYCPLCDSVTLVSRTVTNSNGQTETLDFGVSGALYNSNVLMYDQTHNALWSQLGLKAVSGPHAGTELKLLPVKIIPWSQYQTDHPKGQVISINTGHNRPYDGNPYQVYFENQDYLMVPIAYHGDTLPKKTLGLGIKANDDSFFVAVDTIGESNGNRFVVETKLGKVIAVATEAGVQVLSAPQGVQTVQSFYYSFSAFHPDTKVLTESAE